MAWKLRFIGVFALAAASAPAQIPAATAAELQLMASQAPVIFSGQVTSVAREDAEGFVDVRFRIDQAVRGCPRVGFYVLREWVGLWAGEPDRYRVGQRRLMLLTARGPSGMSSPVGGLDGAIPLLATGAAPIANATGAAPPDTALAPAALAVDLRWIQVRAGLPASNRPTAREISKGVPAHPIQTLTPVAFAEVLAVLQRDPAQLQTTVGDARY